MGFSLSTTPRSARTFPAPPPGGQNPPAAAGDVLGPQRAPDFCPPAGTGLGSRDDLAEHARNTERTPARLLHPRAPRRPGAGRPDRSRGAADLPGVDLQAGRRLWPARRLRVL